MPKAELTYSDEDKSLLERVQQSQGLASIEQAAEWLIKTRLRRAVVKLTGRNRALYEVGKPK